MDEMTENDEEAVRKMFSEMKSTKQVIEKSFYILHFNILCRTDRNEYIPNELGIVKYSVICGIKEIHHCFIHPGSIPLGYASAAKQESESTHLIPLPIFDRADSDYSKICACILSIVNPIHDEIIPVFCLEGNLEQNNGCLDWLSDRIAPSLISNIRLHNLSYLLMELRAYRGSKFAFSSKAVADDLLNSSNFDYIPNTRCDYHEELDNAYCALGRVKIACFIISEQICSLYNVNRTLNHAPPMVTNTGKQFVYKLPSPLPPPRGKRKSKMSSRVPKSYREVESKNQPSTLSSDHYKLAMLSFNKNVEKKDHKNSMYSDKSSFEPNNEIFHPSEPDVTEGFPTLNLTKPRKTEELRQPFSTPLVLLDKEF